MSTGWWYKRFPSDFLRSTMMLSCEEKGAYGVLLDMMYEKNGPIPDDPKWIARMCGCSVRKWTTILRPKLIEMGKINVKEDGSLSNGRVIYETHQAGERIKAAKERHGEAKPAKIAPAVAVEPPRKIPEKTPIIEAKPIVNNELPSSDLGLKERKKERGSLHSPSRPRRGADVCAELPLDLPPAKEREPSDTAVMASVVDDWNAMSSNAGLPLVRFPLSKMRQGKLLARLHEHGIAGIKEAIANVGNSAYCRGMVNGWKGDFDWFSQEVSCRRARQGYYDDRQPAKPNDPWAGYADKLRDAMEAVR